MKRAKEDSPHDFKTMIAQVVFKWWGQCQMNISKKIQLIQAVFIYLSKQNIFQEMINKYPDLETLLEYEDKDANPTLPVGNGVTRQDMAADHDDEIPNVEYIKAGKLSAKVYETIHWLSALIHNEHGYVSLCDSLG